IYSHPAPTKLPGGRLVLTLSDSKKADAFTLDMKKALGTVTFTDGRELKCFFHAEQRVAIITVYDANITSKFIRPDGIDRLKYKPASFGTSDNMSWMVQEASEGLVYATLTATKKVGSKMIIAATITTNQEDPDQPDPLALAKARVTKALESTVEALFETHTKWWDSFWAISEVKIPDTRIMRHYNLVKYFYGAASRPDAPSMPLQAVWTQDSGGLPPWKGDFHHDLNTQMTYLAYHKAGLTDSGMSFINHMTSLMPEYRKFAKDFLGIEDGAAIPSVMSLHGKPLGGWPQYAIAPIFSIWVGQSFYLHWKHTMDDKFLRETAYPWMDEMVSTIVKLLEEKDGKLYLPLSSSAEIFNNSKRAWLTPNSNQDLAMLHWAFEAMAEMADAVGKQDDVKKWTALRSKLNDLHVDDKNILMFSSDEPFNQSHRHHAHVMAIHPFGTLNIDGTDQDRKVIAATLAEMDRLGTRAWTGYSFSWFACILARAGQADLAYQYLTYYERAFILRNGFHVNGDQIPAGLSGFTYRPFTLEGNFLAMEAVHDMVLQSWPVNIAKDPTPVIRIFPAMPWQWHNASFKGLRAEGGYIVSAQRFKNATACFTIKATKTGTLRIRDNFTSKPCFSSKVKKVGNDYVLNIKAGQTLIALIAKPDSMPQEPKESIEVRKRIQRVEDAAKAKKYKISSNPIPLRIGADSNGGNCFNGDMARVSIFNQVLSPGRIELLADNKSPLPLKMEGCVFFCDFTFVENNAFLAKGQKGLKTYIAETKGKFVPPAIPDPLNFNGSSYLNIPHDDILNCNKGITLEAWIKPTVTAGRIIDKSTAGTNNGYNLDMYDNSVRLISNARGTNPLSKTKLEPNKWTHIAGTIDGESGDIAIYINGKKSGLR
ncbi:MAG: hypothetical protein KAS23_07250, partial [Anaerohalosphaera sp.]|nr:hypothetical protein [Anaerohalosphaera sp.]